MKSFLLKADKHWWYAMPCLFFIRLELEQPIMTSIVKQQIRGFLL